MNFQLFIRDEPTQMFFNSNNLELLKDWLNNQWLANGLEFLALNDWFSAHAEVTGNCVTVSSDDDLVTLTLVRVKNIDILDLLKP